MAKQKQGLHIVQNESGEWYGKFIARNGKETWRTSETYKRKKGVGVALASMLNYVKDSRYVKNTEHSSMMVLDAIVSYKSGYVVTEQFF